ncbi:hypothetical protein QLQ80_01805 [Mycoplasma sp. M5725]|uniref:Lipoprotein n=1 Tax=Mycoplasma phocimorsus TaxID=3045839 RepID=A0AAJ1UWN5_9MOLU|nr:hypothetical protein [Mycoplasma phocimorsus]MDJ1645822.1 hypothetical protein [Mycoplasma phocimorsus]
MIKNIIKYIFSLAFLTIGISAISCNPLTFFYNQFSLKETNEVSVELVNDKEVKINSFSPNYTFKNMYVKIFEHKTTKEPYINLVNIFQRIPQFFDKIRITKSKTKPGVYILTNINYNSSILFSVSENRIYFNDMDHFDYLKYITYNPTIKSKKIKIEYRQHHMSKNNKYFDLNQFNMKIYEIEKNIFIPLFII